MANFMEEWLENLRKKKRRLTELKGGDNIMETKSRYEVIADLEKQKRSVIVEGDSFTRQLKELERELKELNRNVEDKKQEIKEFKEEITDKKETAKTLIKSIDDSLDRFAKMGSKK